jgi:hypothetical protein
MMRGVILVGQPSLCLCFDLERIGSRTVGGSNQFIMRALRYRLRFLTLIAAGAGRRQPRTLQSLKFEI